MNDGANNPGVFRIITPDTSNGAFTALTPFQIEALKRCDVLEAGNYESGFYRYYPAHAYPFGTDYGVRIFSYAMLEDSTPSLESFVVDFTAKSMKYEYIELATM